MRVLIIGTHTRVFLILEARTSSLGLEGGSKSYSKESIGFEAIGIYTDNAVVDNTWIVLGLFELRLRIRTCVHGGAAPDLQAYLQPTRAERGPLEVCQNMRPPTPNPRG